MNVEEIRFFCLSLNKVTEDSPFGPQTLVMRVGNKMFALISLDKAGSINLKCDPERAILLREEFTAVKPGWHMNKTHWNTIDYKALPPNLVKELIEHSYELILNSLTKKTRTELSL